MQPRQEAQLLQRAVGGDRAALSELLLQYYDELYRFVADRLHRELQGVWQPEDVLQQTFIRAALGIERFQVQPDCSLAGWLKTISANLIRDAQRRRERERRAGGTPNAAGSSAVPLVNALPADQTSPSGRVQRADRVHRLEAGLERLPPLQRDVLRRYYLQSQSLDDIAQALNCSRDTVRGICYRARNNLRDLLGSSSGYFSS